MKITRESRFALKGLVDIAKHSNNSTPIKIEAVSKRIHVSKGFLTKIFHILNKAGVVKSIRGRNGGYILVDDKLTIYDVLLITEGKLLPEFCIDSDDDCVMLGNCLLHNVWSKLGTVVKDHLNSITIRDLAK